VNVALAYSLCTGTLPDSGPYFMYLAGLQLGIASRGWATLRAAGGRVVVQNDFELITFDFTAWNQILLCVCDRVVSERLPVSDYGGYGELATWHATRHGCHGCVSWLTECPCVVNLNGLVC